MQSTRFPVLVHILVILAVAKDKFFSSSILARSIATNPAVIRKQLATLVAANWIETQSGSLGGAKLVMDPAKITLCDVYELLEQDGVFSMHKSEMRCPVAVVVERCLVPALADAEVAMRDSLAAISIADIAKEAQGDFDTWAAANL